AVQDMEVLEDIRRDAAFSEERILAVSAKTGQGLESLLATIAKHLSEKDTLMTYRIPANDGKAMAWLHKEGEMVDQKAEGDGEALVVKVRLSADNRGRFEARFPYQCQQ